MKRTFVVVFISVGLFMLGACGGGGDGGDPPAAPTNLKVDSTTQDSVTMSWNDNATNETGFYVERASAAAGPFVRVASLGQDETTYTQSPLFSGFNYYYQVCATNTAGDSSFSNVLLAATQAGTNGPIPLPTIAGTLPAVADSFEHVELYAYNSNGRTTTSIYYGHQGPDNTWGTADDIIDYSVTTRHPNAADDFVQVYVYPGADTTWFTNDDPVAGVVTFDYFYGSTGEVRRKLYFWNFGADSTWRTGDDIFSHYREYRYDSNGNRTRVVYYYDPGSDGDWFTSDDVPDRWEDYLFDSAGIPEQRIRYTDPGSDGDWFTSDDLINRYNTWDRDSNGKSIRVIYYNAGNDGTWFNSDDEVRSYRYYVRDSTYGQIIGEYYYTSPGTDGVWFQ